MPTCPPIATCYASVGAGSTRRVDERAHLAHGGCQAHHHAPAYDAVPDVELFDLGDRRDRLDIPVVEAVAGMDGEAALFSRRRRPEQSLEGARPFFDGR